MENRFAIITGASRGIGKAAAFYFAQKNYDLALIARNKERVLAAADEIKTFYPGVSVHTYIVDIGKSHKINKTINQILEKHQHIDVLFNNAGIILPGTAEMTIEGFNSLIQINLVAAFIVASAVARHMKRQKQGYIFNLASLVAKRSLSEVGGYAATKYGLLGLSNGLANEMAPFGVKVTAICPGVTATEMTRELDMQIEEMIQTDDIVKTIDYLLSLGPSASVTDIDIECVKLLADESGTPEFPKK